MFVREKEVGECAIAVGTTIGRQDDRFLGGQFEWRGCFLAEQVVGEHVISFHSGIRKMSLENKKGRRVIYPAASIQRLLLYVGLLSRRWLVRLLLKCTAKAGLLACQEAPTMAAAAVAATKAAFVAEYFNMKP